MEAPFSSISFFFLADILVNAKAPGCSKSGCRSTTPPSPFLPPQLRGGGRSFSV